MIDDSFLLLFNAHDEPMDWILPPEEFAPAWRLVIDTSGVPDLPETIAGGGSVKVADKGMVVLQALAQAQEPLATGARRGRRADDRAGAGADARRVRRVAAETSRCRRRSHGSRTRQLVTEVPARTNRDRDAEAAGDVRAAEFGDRTEPEPAKPAARPRRPKKK